MPNAVTHPTGEQLTAFCRGQLPQAAAAALANHLEACPACRQAVENVPPDSFLGKVRAAQAGDSSLPPGPALTRTGGAPSLRQHASASPVPPAKLPPELANHPKCRVVRELGRGGMGVVYEAVHNQMERTVAIKVINPNVLEHPDALLRFQAEVKAAGKLDHAHIVRAHDAEQVGNLHLLVMEFVEGMNLADLVQQKGPLTLGIACNFLRQAALGLQHAFEQGMVHRDIKPGNLMVTPRGQVKILDFGLARLRNEKAKGRGLTEMGSFMGTPEYVSPEQATDARNADTRADIYSTARIVSGTWVVAKDALTHTDASGQNCCMFFGDPSWTDYDYSFEAVKTDGPFGVSAIFRARDTKNCLIFDLAGWQNRKYTVERFVDGRHNWVTLDRVGAMAPHTRYRVLVMTRGDHFRCYIDDVMIYDFHDNRPNRGAVGFRCWGAAVRLSAISVRDPNGGVLWEGPPNLP